jgi:serine/threonine-protein kinase
VTERVASRTLIGAGEELPKTIREPAFGLPRIGDVVGGVYVVEAPLAAGGMGHILRARNTETGELVALKILDPELGEDRDALDRFTREVQALRAFAIKSKHGVRVHDVGRLETGLPYIAMELLEGRDLGAILAERGPFSALDACRLVLQACEVVIEAHAAGIIHRDLKPRNLFLTVQNGEPRVRVLDFGIARAVGGALGRQPTITRAGDRLGTLKYMAPEQIRNAKAVDPRMDVWSLGACLFKLLDGRAPFHGATEFGLVEAIFRDAPRPTKHPVPAAVAAVVAKCLQKKPEHRFASVLELRKALAEATAALT